ncbi:hypothetical protein Tco_0666969 [Tanacetum coccineum]
MNLELLSGTKQDWLLRVQEEEIDYDETFKPVARTKAIRMSNNVMFLKVVSSLTMSVNVIKPFKWKTLKKKFMDLLKKYEISDISSEKTSMVIPNDSVPDLSCKPVNEIYQANPKESHFNDVKRIFRYLKGTPTLGLWYPKCSGFDLIGYSDLDYAGCNMDMNSTSSACQLLGGSLMFWSAKKQQSVAISSTEAEYVDVAGCCAKILRMKSQVSDYDIQYKMVAIFCDNTSALTISNNHVLHPGTKHIDIRYHFFIDHIIKEFWCTAMVKRPRPPTEDSETLPLRESRIRFTVKNGGTPLYFDFKTFCQCTRLDYNNGTYVAMLQTEAVKPELLKFGLHNDRTKTETPNILVNKTPLLKTCFLAVWRLLMTFVIQVLGGNKSSIDKLNPSQQMIVFTDQLNSSQQMIVFSLLTKKKIDMERSFTMILLLNTNSAQDKLLGCTHSVLPLVSPTPSLKKVRKKKEVLNYYEIFMENSKGDLKELSDEEVFEAGYEMEDVFPLNTEEESQPPSSTNKPESSKSKKLKKSEPSLKPSSEPSDSESSSVSLPFKDYDNYMLIIERVLARNIQDVIKDDLALNAKVVESIDAYVKNLAKLTELNLHMKEASSTYRQIFINLSNLVELLREANTPGLRNTLETIQNSINAHAAHHDTLVATYRSLAWNVGPRLTRIKLNQESIKSDIASLKTNTIDIKTMMSEIFYTFIGQPFFVPSGSVPILILALIDVTTTVRGRIQHQGSLRKKKKLPLNLRGKQIEQAMKEAKLSEPKIKKVVAEIVNEAKVQIKGTKYFLKHQDAHFQVLARAHNEKLKKKADQRKKRFDQYLGLDLSLPLPEQDPSLPKKKRKAMELESENIHF